MLFGDSPHILRPGHNVLVCGSSGGHGSMAVLVTAKRPGPHTAEDAIEELGGSPPTTKFARGFRYQLNRKN